MSGALRVGTSIATRWGVELEFVRSGRSHAEGPIAVPVIQTGTVAATSVQLVTPGAVPGYIPIPVPYDYRSDVTRRATSVDAVAWARQPVSGSVDLVYLGGVAFSRDRSDITQIISPVPRSTVPPATGLVVPTARFRSTLIQYDTSPLVGMEARIGLASRLRLVPGLRLQGLSNGWLVRPYVGLGWFF